MLGSFGGFRIGFVWVDAASLSHIKLCFHEGQGAGFPLEHLLSRKKLIKIFVTLWILRGLEGEFG